MRKVELLLALALVAMPVAAQDQPATSPATKTEAKKTNKMPQGAAVFIEPMDGFDTYLAAGMLKKKVPLRIVDDKSKANYVISGSSKKVEAGWAKTIFISPAAHASASIMIKDAKTGDMVFAYNVDKNSAARGEQSTAEACAKHMKEAIEK